MDENGDLVLYPREYTLVVEVDAKTASKFISTFVGDSKVSTGWRAEEVSYGI